MKKKLLFTFGLTLFSWFGCHLVACIIVVVSIRRFGFRRGAVCICVWAIQISKVHTKTKNQINSRQYIVKFESNVF